MLSTSLCGVWMLCHIGDPT